MIIDDKVRIVERFLKREKQADLAREYGVSREAIRLIIVSRLGQLGIDKLYQRWDHEDIAIIAHLIEQDPLITVPEMENLTGFTAGRIKGLLKKYPIARDIGKIRKKVVTEGKRKGRIPLTKEFLQYQYLILNKSAKEISRETGWDMVTVNKHIQEFRLLKRPYGANVKRNNLN